MTSMRWARKCERYCCVGVTYLPLAFVYGITTWAVWVETTIGFLSGKTDWTGKSESFLGIVLYLLLNWSYTTAVFTSPGTTSSQSGYSSLPTHVEPAATNFTVKSNGELRYCKKCEARKPDRAHHCSTCRTCVLKMDHHCPWLATCVGLHNYKAFLLFLSYTVLFCFLCFWVSFNWVWRELLSEGEYTESLLPVNYVMLVVIAGIIGLVLAGFTGWHILLACRGQTTIECLETTRYLSPLRKSINRPPPANGMGRSYEEIERTRARDRYEEYLDEQDSEKLPSAFDLGWKRNLGHLFGPKPLLWFFPVCNTTGDGWIWEPSPKWLEARERISQEREAQKQREIAAGWGGPVSPAFPPPQQELGASRHYASSKPSRSSSKADRILGRDPGQFTDFEPNSHSLRTLNSQGRDEEYDSSSDEDEAAQRVLDRKAAKGWPQRVGVVTNTLLGNTLSRQKDDKSWVGQADEGVD